MGYTDPFADQREQMLRALIPPVQHSFAQHDDLDDASVLFDGSFDWHSAVHAALCLHILTRETGESRYVEVFEAKNQPGAVEAELQYMQQVAPRENPYGFAWLLALTAQRQAVVQRDDLLPLAEYAVSSLRELVDGLTPQQASNQVGIDSHNNLTWALIQVHDWARHSQDAALQAWVEERSMAILCDPALDHKLSVEAELGAQAREFFSPPLMRLAAVAKIWRAQQWAREFVADRLPEPLTVEPVENPATVHAYGLTFSRAYALWHLWQATGREHLREQYVSLMSHQVWDAPDWDEQSRGGYAVSHWVPQFGIIALEQSLPTAH